MIGLSIGFGNVFLLIILLIAVVLSIVYGIKFKYKFLLFFLAPIFLLGLIAIISSIRHGSYKLYDTMKDLGMELVEQRMSSGTYKKGNLEVSYSENTMTDVYIISDQGNIDFKSHQKLLNLFFNFGEGTTQMIYENLLQDAKYSNGISKMVIMDNHVKLEIIYELRKESIKYEINKEKFVDEIETNDYGYDEHIYNDNYDKLYLSPELHLNHGNNDDSNDEKLLKLLFNKEKYMFDKETLDDGTIVYKHNKNKYYYKNPY